MEDRKLSLREVGFVLAEMVTQHYYELLERNSESKLTAIKTCTRIASRLDVQSYFEEKFGPIPQETQYLAQRFLQEYGPRYWDEYPGHVYKFEHAILRPDENDLPKHTQAELKQLNELLTNRLNTQDVDKWSMEEKHQVLSLALSTFDEMAKGRRWTLYFKLAL